MIEISDTTQRYDMGRKAAIYRDHGVREYWVLDVVKRESHVHLLGVDGAWPKGAVSFDEVVAPTLVSGLSVRIADLVR